MMMKLIVTTNKNMSIDHDISGSPIQGLKS